MVLVDIGRQTFDAKTAPIVLLFCEKLCERQALTNKTIKQHLKITNSDFFKNEEWMQVLIG